MSVRLITIKQEEHYSDLKEITTGVPHGSVLEPILHF